MKLANELIDFIHEGPSPFHVVRQAEIVLEAAGFVRLDHTKRWKLQPGGRYYVTTNGSALIAWIVGSGELEEQGFRLVQTHVDSPSIRIKPSPEMTAAGGFLKLNAEVYGSPILSTWLDRPLALAGRVSLRSADVMHPRQVLVDFPDPQLYIPNISIHHNKGVNAGVELNPQKDMLPILGMLEAGTVSKDTLLAMLADRIGYKAEDILDYDLYTSEYERGCLMGRKQEFISSKKLDNLSLVYASVRVLVAQTNTTCTPVICCLDNEEIGNRTRQGADSPMLATVLERIASALGKDREDFFRAMQNSFMLSADMSHAVHPNAPDRSDPVVQVKLNGGPVIKYSGAQKFTTNSESSAVFQQLCELAQVPWQYYVNKSDSPGGSAAGTDSITHADMRSVDIGLALLAMHSIREIGGTADNAYMHTVLERFFKQGN
jgi:aspartyl aminopeptidase